MKIDDLAVHNFSRLALVIVICIALGVGYWFLTKSN